MKLMRPNYVLAKLCVLQEVREEEGREVREERQRKEEERRPEPNEVCMTKHLHILFSYFILQSHLIG